MVDPALRSALARLAEVRRLARRHYALNGTAVLLLAFSVWAIITYVLDRHIPNHLPDYVRLFFSAAGVAVAAAVAWRTLVYPLRAPMRDDDLALVVERVHPALGDRLISALQLTRDPSRYPEASAELVRAVAADAAEHVRRIDFRRALAPRPVQRRFRFASALFGALVVFAAADPSSATTWFLRMLGSRDAKWPQETYLVLTTVPPAQGDGRRILIAKGDDLSVTAMIAARSTRVPSSVEFDYRYEAVPGGPAEADRGTARMKRLAASEFRHDVLQVNAPLEFQVRGGDDRTDWIRVDVATPPAVESIVLWYDYPEYTGLPDTPPGRPEPEGNIRAPVGTRVAFRAVANSPLSGASLALGAAGREQASPLEVEADAAGVRRIVRGEIAVVESSEYQVRLTGENGLPDRRPARYTIRAAPDAPPLVKVLEPGSDRRVSREAVYPLRLAVADDFGIREIRLIHRMKSRDADPEKTLVFGPAHLSAPYGKPKIDAATNFDLAALGVRDGDVVEYRFEAEDYKTGEPRNLSKTRTYLFTVVEKSLLQQEKEGELDRIREELRAIREAEDRLRARTDRLRERHGEKASLERGERAEISAAGSDQGRLGARIEYALRKLETAVRDATYNRLIDRESEGKLVRVQEILRTLSEGRSPEAVQALSEAAVTAAARKESFTRALDRQGAILEGLDEALRLLEEYATYQEIVKLLQSYKIMQEQILKDLIERRQKPN